MNLPKFKYQRTKAELAAMQAAGLPRIRDSYAIVFVALSVVILTYSGLVSIAPILVFYLIWIPQVLLRGWSVLRLTKDVALPLAFAGFGLVSILWSDYPDASLRAGLEVSSMIICTIIMARTVSIGAFMKGLIAGICAVLVIMFFFSSTFGVDLFGSKNQVGFVAEIGLYATLIYLCTSRFQILRFMLLMAALAICSVSLYISHSATSTASFAATLIMSVVAYFLVKFPMRHRGPLLAVAIVSMVALAVAAAYFNLYGAGLNALGKDQTLTGRTYLWSEGFKVGLERPLIGHGYYAFWIPGQPQAEKYWFQFYERSGAGFHFHNLYIQTFVDLGFAGFVIIALLMLSSCVRSLRYIIRNEIDLTSIFAFGMSIMFLVRSMTEVDILGPFGVGLLVFYSIVPRLATMRGSANGDIATPRKKPGLMQRTFPHSPKPPRIS